MQSSDKTLRVYFGHHKCGSTWLTHVLLKVTGELGLRHVIARPCKFGTDFVDIRRGPADVVLSLEACSDHVKDLGSLRGFHVIRDPRDMCVSAYFSHLHSHAINGWSQLRQLRSRLHSVSREEGLILEMKFLGYFYRNMYRWNYENPAILELRFEEIIQDAEAHLARILDFLGLLDDGLMTPGEAVYHAGRALVNRVHRRQPDLFPLCLPREKIPYERLQQIVEASSFEQMSKGRARGTENVRSHYRKGVAGDWVNHFTKRHKDYFKRYLNPLLVKLGYANDDAW
jgi:hypothetical protein